MTTPPRLVPLLEQFDWACERLTDRMTGPAGDSGTGVSIAVPPMTDAEYLWEPVPGCWSIRPRSAGPGSGATLLAGAGEWGRDSASPAHPWPPPFTTIAWRLGHLSEMLALRADHMTGSHALTRDDYRFHGDAAGGIAAFGAGAQAWRQVLAGADDAGARPGRAQHLPVRQRPGRPVHRDRLVGQPGGAAPRGRDRLAARSVPRPAGLSAPARPAVTPRPSGYLSQFRWRGRDACFHTWRAWARSSSA